MGEISGSFKDIASWITRIVCSLTNCFFFPVPLPAIIFLCCLLLLLAILAIVYFTVLKKDNLCAGLTGHGTEEGLPEEGI